ncbi:hypothetical protein Hanom_Chr03g00240851 [Helianthus anomalus]
MYKSKKPKVQHFYAVKRLSYMRRAPQANKPTKKHQKMRLLVASCNYTRREAKKPQALRLGALFKTKNESINLLLLVISVKS